MTSRHKDNNKTEQVDKDFEPWEQSRPIPLIVIGIIFALAMWGAMTYFIDLYTPRAPVDQLAVIEQPKADNAATGIKNASGDTLAIVNTGTGAAWSCASCHGAQGEGNLSTPRLAGLQEAYIATQLRNFANGNRQNESMQLVSRELDEHQITELARYYAQLSVPSTAQPRLGADLERGKQLVMQGDWKINVPACVTCHGSDARGVAPNFPALAGQQPEYIFAQLAAWHGSERKNSPQALMDDIAQRMAPEDMRAAADYLATMQPNMNRQAGQ